MAAVWTDAMQRHVVLPDEPQRIVSLVPSVTETLFALGLEERIVGVTNFCTYPERARNKPQVGDYSAPNLEAIVLQRPDLIIISADSATPARLSKMEGLGLSVYVIYPKGLDATLSMFRALGQITGKEVAANQLVQQLTDTLTELKKAVQGRKQPKILFCVMVQPLTVAGPETLAGDLIRAAGGENIVPAGSNRYPTWSYEALLLADPEIIIVSPHPGAPNPVDLFATWPELSAVRNKQVISVEPDWVLRPGPRLPLGLTALAEAFHGPGISAKIKPVAP
jgi:iron complex transport system substrate-binding protein